MKGIKFYADPYGSQCAGPNKSHSKLTRKDYRQLAEAGAWVNCIAVLQGREHLCPDYSQEALVATFTHSNSDVAFSSVSREYLARCKHIDEATARRLHPRLAQRLDME